MTSMTDNRTTEQAIAATLRKDEPPYDVLLQCLENDWHIHASWDGLRKFWCIELTEEGVKLRDATHGTLTAEQVREAIMSVDRWEKPMGNTGMTNTHLIIRDDGWQAIADELNAELGGGNCARCAEDMGRYADSLCDPLKERIAELLRCLENDWHIHASWDGLRMFWCIELTEEGVWMRDAARLYDKRLQPDILRCRDCKRIEYCCFVYEYDYDPDGFCAWGERRES